jgi:hypothetical protein
MRVDSSGLLRVANTSGTLFNSDSATGVVAGTSLQVSTDGSTVGYFNRLSSDGVVLGLYKDGSSVGSVGANGSRPFVAGPSKGIKFGNSSADPCTDSGGTADNSYDLGGSSVRWNNLYLSGGVFVGGTGSGNKLEDYEEGTFTPVLAYATGGTTGIAYTNQIGRYTKIGRAVSIYFRIVLSNKGSGSGNAYISGLPFAVANVTQYPAAYGLHHDVNSGSGNSVANVLPIGQLFNNTTTLYWYNADSTTAITADYFNNNSTINGNVVYET